MRKSILFGVVFLIASCTVYKEEEFESPDQHRYHAVAEDPVDSETRVYADSKLRVHWNEGDHISIFERTTYNREFEFLGDTGDTAGDFDPVPSSGYYTEDDIEDGHVYAVYPYNNKNKCDGDGKLTVTFPSIQHYKKDSFGIGANIMVAKTSAMDLRFMHVGGYRTFKLYGDGVFVSSIRIESNGDEFLSGRTDVTIGSDGKPAASFIESETNSKSVELVCDTPVALGGTEADAVEFWFVLPPGTLIQGFTVTITDSNGNEFTKSTSNSVEIKSGVKKSMAAFEVVVEHIQPNNVIYYTSSDGQIITPYATDAFGASIVSNKYDNGQGVITFNGDVTSIGTCAFDHCSSLTSITIPESVTSIGGYAFSCCSSLISITIPESVTSIGDAAFGGLTNLTSITIPEGVKSISYATFSGCHNLTNVTIPEGVTSIGTCAFDHCSSLTSITIPESVTSIEGAAFRDCLSLSSITIPNSVTSIENQVFQFCSSLTSITIPEGVTSIGGAAFSCCSSLISITIPESVTSIGEDAFSNTSLTSITIPEGVKSIGYWAFNRCSSLTCIYVMAAIPPTIVAAEFDSQIHDLGTYEATIYVPSQSLEAYKAFWRDHYGQIQAIPTTSEINGHAYVEMGDGLKWATMNVGANSPEDYGDYFAWGETEPYYSFIDPYSTNPQFIWKQGKEYGYGWASYQFNPSHNGVDFSKYTGSDFDTLQSEDDAATQIWGGSWRMPTISEFEELLDPDKFTLTRGTIGNRYILTVESKIPGYEGNKIILPANGWISGSSTASSLHDFGSDFYYWSSTFGWDTYSARHFIYDTATGNIACSSSFRYYGESIRPVSD